MKAKSTDQIHAQFESRVWGLLGLSIVLLLALSATIPLLLLSLVRAGLLDPAFEGGGGFGIVAGLIGLTMVFSLVLVQRMTELNRVRRRLVYEQIELEQSKSRLSELTSLFQLDNSLHMRLPLQTILDITVRRIGSTLHAHEVDIYLFSAETKTLRCSASFGLTARPPQPDAPFGEGPVGVCAKRRQSVLLPAPDAGSPFAEHMASHPEIGSMILVPLLEEKACIGVLQIARTATAEPLRTEHRDLARLFSDNIAPVIARARAGVPEPSALETVTDDGVGTPSVAGPFQDSLLHSAGQELKSPLTSILAYAEVLDQNDGRMAPAMRAEFSGRVRAEAKQLLGLVDDVLDAVRMELGLYLLELRPADLNVIVAESIEAVRAQATEKGISIGVALDGSISSQHVDPAKLRHSVIQLLRNAIASSPAQGRVGVATRLEGRNVRITVLDQGPALDAAHPEAIYDIGEPEAGQSRGKNGVGFGLHLAKRFAELHGGHAGASISTDGSNAFWIEIPWSSNLSSVMGEDVFAEELTRS